MKYSVYTLLFKDRDLKEIPPILSELGYDGIEIRIHDDGIHLPIDPSSEKITEARKLAQDYGLEIPIISSYAKFGYPENRWKIEKEKMIKIASIADKLEAKYFRVQTAGYDDLLGYEKIRRFIRKQILELHSTLKEMNIKALPVIEQHGGGCIASSAGIIIDLIRDIDPEKIGVLYDPGNAVWEGWEPPIVQIDILKDYIKHVHVKNYDRDKTDPRKVVPAPLDKGILDWREVIRILKNKGYKGYLSLEDFRSIPPEEKAKQAIIFFRQVESLS